MSNLWLDFLLTLFLGAMLVAVFVLVRGVPMRLQYFTALARQAGFHPERLFPIHWGAKILLTALLPMLVMEVTEGGIGFLGFVSMAIVGFLLPDLFLLVRRKRRQKKILYVLPFFLDLLVSLLRSGLGLEEAFHRAGTKGLRKDNPLAFEVERVSREIDAGRDRTTAFRALAERTGLHELQVVASAMELGTRLGYPVADTLESQADLHRDRRIERGKTKIERAMIISLLPIMLCGYPLFIVLVGFPALLELREAFGMLQYLM